MYNIYLLKFNLEMTFLYSKLQVINIISTKIYVILKLNNFSVYINIIVYPQINKIRLWIPDSILKVDFRAYANYLRFNVWIIQSSLDIMQLAPI